MPRRIAVLLALVVAVAGACNDADGDGQVKSSGDVSVNDLRPGDCFNGSPQVVEAAGEEERDVTVVAAVPCDESHEDEVFAVFDHPGSDNAPFPGEEAVTKVAQDGCVERFPGYMGRPYEKSKLQVTVIAPGAENWDNGDRAIVCLVFGDKPIKGSQKADGG